MTLFELGLLLICLFVLLNEVIVGLADAVDLIVDVLLHQMVVSSEDIVDLLYSVDPPVDLNAYKIVIYPQSHVLHLEDWRELLKPSYKIFSGAKLPLGAKEVLL